MKNTLKQRIKLQSLIVLGSLMILFVMFSSSALAIARGYTTEDSGLQTGMVVSLSSEGADDQVERATQETSNQVVGVISTVEGSLVTVSSDNAEVFVESEEQVDVYVSDINGAVEKGDLLILSPLKGILMKAPENTNLKVIGIAAQTASGATAYQYQEGDQNKETQIAKIKIDLNYLGSNNTAANDSTLARLGKSVVGRDVGETRVLIALIIFVIVLIAEGSILYGTISSGIIALGRNPLARKIIRAELLRVILVAFGVLVIGLGFVYVILWI